MDAGGALISTGNAAALREDLSERGRRWRGGPERYRHFDRRVEKEYADVRKPVGIHNAITAPAGDLADAVRELLPEPSVVIEPAVPLLALNHTELPDGEAVHLVNRHVNLFTRIRLRPREGLTLRLIPRKPISRGVLLSPDQPPQPLSSDTAGLYHNFTLPTLHAYGVLRVFH